MIFFLQHRNFLFVVLVSALVFCIVVVILIKYLGFLNHRNTVSANGFCILWSSCYFSCMPCKCRLFVGGISVLTGALQTTGFDFSLGFSFNCRTINWLRWFCMFMEVTSFPNKNHRAFWSFIKSTHNFYYHKGNLTSIVKIFNLSWLTDQPSRELDLEI